MIRLLLCVLLLSSSGCFLYKAAPFLLFGINPLTLPPPCDQTDAGCPTYDGGPTNEGCLPGDTCNQGTVNYEPREP